MSFSLAEMASTVTPTYKKPLVFGHFEWIEELKRHDRHDQCISYHTPLKIIEHEETAHVIGFHLAKYFLPFDGKKWFFVGFKYRNGILNLEKNLKLDFKLSLSKQNIDGEFTYVFRNYEASKVGCIYDPHDKSNYSPFWKQSISKDKMMYCRFPYIDGTHKLTGADFERNAKVKIELFLSIDYAKPKLTDTTEPTLEEMMQKLCFKDDLSDIKIICDGQEFPCHKLILSARSDVFKTMFASPLKMNEKEESILEIPDISAETMKTFLQFIYKDDIEADDIDQDLLIAADKYNIKRLVNICVNYFKSIINAENVMAITYAAYLISNDYLLEQASKFIFQNHGKIKKPEDWDQIKKTHPHIVTKVVDLVIFENQPSASSQR